MAVVRMVLRLHCSWSSPCGLPDFVNGVENMKRSKNEKRRMKIANLERELGIRRKFRQKGYF